MNAVKNAHGPDFLSFFQFCQKLGDTTGAVRFPCLLLSPVVGERKIDTILH